MRNKFYLVMSIILILIVFAGFAQSFYLAPMFETEPDIPIEYVHGAVMSAWFIIFMLQTSLVAAGRSDIHRRLGILGAVIGVGVIVMGLIVIVQIPAWLITQGTDFSIEETQQIWSQVLWGDFGSIMAFSMFFGLGMLYRKRTNVHKRLMLLATISIIGPAISRISVFPIFDGISTPVFSWSGILLLILATAGNDLLIGKRVHVVTFVGGSLFLAVRYVFPIIIGNSAMGRAVFLSLSANS